MTPDQLKDLFERETSVLTRRPDLASRSGQARARLHGPTLGCEVAHEDCTQHVDLPADQGGKGEAPHPGQLLRASLCACLAMGYRLWGARLSVPVEGVEVEVTCALDVRGQLGLDPGVRIGWQRIVIETCLWSSAPEADLQRVVETAQRLSPMLANLSPAIERVHHLRIVRPHQGTLRSA